MCIIQLGILGLRKVFANDKGIAVVTQPLTAIMNEKLKSTLVKTAVLSMKGILKKEGTEEVELNCLEEEVLDGKFPVVIGHPESWKSNRGQKLLMEMKKRNMILLVAVDEFHQGMTGHWDLFRPEMNSVIARLRLFRAAGAPCLATSATATSSEVSSMTSTLGLRTAPVLLHASPTQYNIKIVKLRRPPNNYGPDGYTDKDGVKVDGYLSTLQRIILAQFIKSVREGKTVKKGIIFCRSDY